MERRKKIVQDVKLEEKYKKSINFKKRQDFIKKNITKISHLLSSQYLDILLSFYELNGQKLSIHKKALKLQVEQETLLKMLKKAYTFVYQNI